MYRLFCTLLRETGLFRIDRVMISMRLDVDKFTIIIIWEHINNNNFYTNLYIKL